MRKSLLEHLIHILTEAPMSDEDREDSAILRDIFAKRQNRSNAKLTPAEKAILNKYGVEMDADHLLIPDSGNSKWNWVKGSSFVQNWMDPDINVADKIRKTPQRDYARSVNNTRDPYWDEENREAGLGAEYDNRSWQDQNLNFQERERFRNAQYDKYRSAVKSMKNDLRDRKHNNDSLASYDSEKAKLDQEYQRKLQSLERSNEYNLKRRDSINKDIEDIKNRFRRDK